jgi:hypothetical protein
MPFFVSGHLKVQGSSIEYLRTVPYSTIVSAAACRQETIRLTKSALPVTRESGLLDLAWFGTSFNFAITNVS